MRCCKLTIVLVNNTEHQSELRHILHNVQHEHVPTVNSKRHFCTLGHSECDYLTMADNVCYNIKQCCLMYSLTVIKLSALNILLEHQEKHHCEIQQLIC